MNYKPLAGEVIGADRLGRFFYRFVGLARHALEQLEHGFFHRHVEGKDDEGEDHGDDKDDRHENDHLFTVGPIDLA